MLQVGFVETTEQRQRQEAVCDRAAVRRRFRAFDIDMDPLKVAGRLSELVDGCWSTVTQSVTQTSLPTAVRTSLGFSKRMAFSIYRLLGELAENQCSVRLYHGSGDSSAPVRRSLNGALR